MTAKAASTAEEFELIDSAENSVTQRPGNSQPYFKQIRYVPIDEDSSQPDVRLIMTDDFGSTAHNESIHTEDADNGADDLFNEANDGLQQDQLIQQTAITTAIADADASLEPQTPSRK
uniref:Uncharacterized protein n=1 Tax=Plectus sambesii TaxID=2011161 RepID=A0A914VYR9_9BILA